MNFLKTAIAVVALVFVSSAAYAQNNDFDLGVGYEGDFVQHPDFDSAYGDPCQGQIEGTWGYKGGRPMSITLIRNGRHSVIVNVSQRNGGESLSGICREDRYDGSARVEFSGGANSGNLLIDSYGQVRGVVSGFSFRGQKE